MCGWEYELNLGYYRSFPDIGLQGWAVSIHYNDKDKWCVVEQVGSEELIKKNIPTLAEAKRWVMDTAETLRKSH